MDERYRQLINEEKKDSLEYAKALQFLAENVGILIEKLDPAD